jgi:hypothetical protein
MLQKDFDERVYSGILGKVIAFISVNLFNLR